MEKNQFDTLMLAITGLDAKLTGKINDLDAKLTAKVDGLEAKMNARFEAMDKRFDNIEIQLNAIKEQTASTVENVADHESRIRKLEGPSA